MMVVMVISIILFGIAAKALLRNGSVLQSAIPMVRGKLSNGRLFAIKSRKKIAVLMPGPNAIACDADKRYSAMRMAYVKEILSPDGFEFVGWYEDSKWEYVSTGALIMECDDDIGVQNGGVYVTTPNDDGFSRVDAVPLDGIGGGLTNGVRAVVFTSTGKVTGSSTYVTVGEAAFTGAWVVKKVGDIPTNKSAADQVTFELNVYTGHFEVKNPPDY